MPAAKACLSTFPRERFFRLRRGGRSCAGRYADWQQFLLTGISRITSLLSPVGLACACGGIGNAGRALCRPNESSIDGPVQTARAFRDSLSA